MAVLRVAIEPEDGQLRIWRNPQTGWLQIRGEIDAWNVEAVREALRVAHRGEGDLHLDVSQLLFCDVTGIRAIAATAINLEGGRRLVLHGLDPQLQRVFQVVGWGSIRNLVIDANGVHA
jgi:anti-anti-sigma factor